MTAPLPAHISSSEKHILFVDESFLQKLHLIILCI